MGGPIKLSSPETRQFWEIAVLYQDDHLLALDKPPGLPVSPDPTNPTRPSLMQLLHSGIAAQKPWAKELVFLDNAHRLDAELSGVVLLARDKPTLLKLADWFGAGKAGRRYVALVEGAPEADTFEVAAKLAPHPARNGLMRVDSRGGKTARTLFQVVERLCGYTLLNCEALADRRHQVRVHLRHAHLPVAGDAMYGGKPLFLSHLKPGYRPKTRQAEQPLLGRPALHADLLSLPHPVTGQELSIRAEWPKELRVVLKYLHRFGGAPVRT
jgi:RluA family pseudouridine synthase